MALVTLDAKSIRQGRRLFQNYTTTESMESYGSYYETYKQGYKKNKWNCSLSSSYQTLQGIRQGAKLSTTLYKRFSNHILLQIEEHNLATNIGTTNVGAPTVADDISMLPSTPIDTQVVLNTVVNNAKQDKVNFNAIKSDIIIYNQPNAPTSQWDMVKDRIESSNSTTHLGLLRENTNKFNIQRKIQTARKTMYSLWARDCMVDGA